jgi:hypothetical protein
VGKKMNEKTLKDLFGSLQTKKQDRVLAQKRRTMRLAQKDALMKKFGPDKNAFEQNSPPS